MDEKNIFAGDSLVAEATRIAYNLLVLNRKSCEWVNYQMIYDELDAKLHDTTVEERRKAAAGSSRDTNLNAHVKKAMQRLLNALRQIDPASVEKDGNNRNCRFRYVAADDDPLRDWRHELLLKDVDSFQQFCKDSAGFFPLTWMRHFFQESCPDILNDMRQNGRQILSTGSERALTNIDLLPAFYEYIKNRRVVNLTHQPSYESKESLTFHPHYLKEFNGRWFVLGYCEEQAREGFIIALDRIEGRPILNLKVPYRPSRGFYRNFFDDIVGVTHLDDEPLQDVRVRVYSHYQFRLTETKRIHPSQQTLVPFGAHADGEYGEFGLRVRFNKEFLGCLRQRGEDYEIVEPASFRERMRESLQRLMEHYK